jgi:hypothetical protein
VIAVYILAAGALANAFMSSRERRYGPRLAFTASAALCVLAAAYVALSTRRLS